MSEIADEFKIVVVEAIKALCLKFPQARAQRWCYVCHGGGGVLLQPFAASCGLLRLMRLPG